MERETREITTPVGKSKVKIYSYMTGREKREITNVFLSAAKFSVGSDQQFKTDNVDATVTNKARDKAMELLVVSVGDSDENMIERILDMRSEDYDFISKEIDKITQPTDKKK